MNDTGSSTDASTTDASPNAVPSPADSTMMRAAVLHGIEDMRIEQRAVPDPGPDDVLVKIAAVTICGSDTHYYLDGRIGEHLLDGPLVLGHEASGTIVKVGANIDQAKIGERVSLEPGVPRPYSPETLAGRYNLDPNVSFFATPPVDGTLAEYVAHPARFCHTIPNAISDTAGALLEPLSVAIAGTGAGHVGLGDHVLIGGAGPIGLLLAAVAKLRGATHVHVFDVREERLKTALAYGADSVSTPDRVELELSRVGAPWTAGGFDVFLDATGAQAAVTVGIQQVRPAGRVVLVGMGVDEVTLPMSVLQAREVQVTGTFRYRNTWPLAIEIAAQQLIDLEGLVTSRFELEDAEQALTAGARPGQIKALVHP